MELVCAICNHVRSGTKQGLNFQQLINRVRREFKLSDIQIKISAKRDKTLNEDCIYVNGFYDPEDDQENECAIELIVTHNFPKDLLWYPIDSTLVLTQIFDTVVHELRHQRQYRKRKFKVGPERGTGHKEYLADPDEIDAYSISIATELVRSLGRIRALRYMHNINTLSRFKLNKQFVSPCLSMYLGEFPDTADPVIKNLTKKIYIRLKKIDTDVVFL
jgi:hypothetical protein